MTILSIQSQSQIQEWCVHCKIEPTHPAHQFPPAVHAQVEVGLFAPDSHLTPEGVGLHHELGLWRDTHTDRQEYRQAKDVLDLPFFVTSARENIAREFFLF